LPFSVIEYVPRREPEVKNFSERFMMPSVFARLRGGVTPTRLKQAFRLSIPNSCLPR
jgi:hypothetical protein